jgi:hypothetical protein
MIILVCGGRNYTGRDRVNWVLSTQDINRGPIRGLIHGCAGKRTEDGKVLCGADLLADEWQRANIEREIAQCAENRRLDPGGTKGLARNTERWIKGHPADWDKYGKLAGPIRNREMLEQNNPELVVAFPGGNGTADMVRQAAAKKIEILLVPDHGYWRYYASADN